MPRQQTGPKKRSKAQKEQLALVHVKRANPDTLEPSVESLKSSLGSTQKQLESASTHLEKAQSQVQALEEKSQGLYSTLRVERRIKLSALQLESFCWKNRSSF
jgi:chromosome segregation ATPase